MYKGRTITVVIPCLNEEDAVGHTLGKIPDVIDEIIVADNGSTDNSPVIAEKGGAKVVIEPRRGYGYALKAGIGAATKDIVVTMDGDGTYPIEDIREVLDSMFERDLDFVSGRRLPLMTPKAMGRTNIFGTKVLGIIALILFGFRSKDILSGMWFFKREVFPRYKLISNDWNLSEEIKIEARRTSRYGEHHINHHIRLGETKLLKWRVGVENVFFLFWKRLFRYKALPKWLKLT
jgi:glycosyltransferase involved in cell wall biosynthesis